MEFDDFARRIDAAVRAAAAIDRFDEPQGTAAAWTAHGRNAALELVPPQNVSLTLAGRTEAAGTTWYPVDAALVPVVSQRIAGYLGGD
jgi:hypothetical protein